MSSTPSCLFAIALLATGCGTVTAPASDAATDSHPGVDARTTDARTTDAPLDARVRQDASADGGALTWYWTCGDPVCHVAADGGAGDAGVCPDAGSPCATKGAGCGTPTVGTCGATLLCDDHNPAVECPISSRKFKDGIRYADEAALSRLHDETLGLKLANYTYKPEVADPGVPHLGFIIEDSPDVQAVDGPRNRVDMYGYVSMVVASLQVQEREIAALKGELQAVRKEAAACNGARK